MLENAPSLAKDTLIPIAVVAIVFGSGLVIAVAAQVRSYLCHRQEIELKRELLDRGMSVDEIERVMAAGKSDG